MLAADTTRVLLVGISCYDNPSLRLKFATANARGLYDALLLKEGCAIPESHLTLLPDAEARRENVLAHLKRIATDCVSEDFLIFYFSGHGEKEGSSFYLVPVGADPADLSNTAISAERLQEAIVDCKARGILFILDCCKSAGFAENASAFFQTIADRDFRLLLSASRAGQVSYEFDKEEGTFFTRAIEDVLLGRSVIGSTPGVVYFSDLFEHVQAEVAEKLESIGQPSNAQEPVFAGTYSRDPRLFILTRLSLERIESETPRYSRKFLRHRIKRLIQTIAVSVIFILAAYYTYLDHARYIWHESGIVSGFEGDYLSIYAGDPRINWLGFPHRIRTTDLRTDALPTVLRPGVGSPLRASLSSDIERDLLSALTPEFKVSAFVWRGDEQSALKYAKDLDVYDPPVAPGTTEAVEDLASLASPAAESVLENDLLESDEIDSSSAVLRRMASTDSDNAIDTIEHEDTFGGGFDSPKQQRAILEGFPPHCDPATKDYIVKMAPRSDDDSYMHNSWTGALLRTGCALPAETLSGLLDHFPGQYMRQLDLVAYVGREKPVGFGAILAAHLKKISAETHTKTDDSLRNYRDSYKLWLDLRLLALVYPHSVPRETYQLLDSPWKCVRVAASRALMASDPTALAMLVRKYFSDPWILSTLVENGWYDEKVARQTIIPLSLEKQKNGGMSSVQYFLRALRLRNAVASKPLVEDILNSAPLIELRLEALRTLSSIEGRPEANESAVDPIDLFSVLGYKSAESGIDNLNQFSVLHGTFWWYVRHDRRAAQWVLNHIGDNIDDTAETFGRAVLRDADLSAFRAKLNSDSARLAAATVLGMRGTRDDLRLLLNSPDYNLRNQTMLYAVYNPNLETVLDHDLIDHVGLRTKKYVHDQLALRKQIEQQITNTPPWLRRAALPVYSFEFPDASDGLRHWIEDEIDKLEGPATDDLEEILAPVNLPAPVSADKHEMK